MSAAVLNLPSLLNITILNRHHGTPATAAVRIYIGRGSALGNDYEIGKHGTRAQCIEQYEVWLIGQLANPRSAAARAISGIVPLALSRGVELLCSCAPQPCHGDSVVHVCNAIHYGLPLIAPADAPGRQAALHF